MVEWPVFQAGIAGSIPAGGTDSSRAIFSFAYTWVLKLSGESALLKPGRAVFDSCDATNYKLFSLPANRCLKAKRQPILFRPLRYQIHVFIAGECIETGP